MRRWICPVALSAGVMSGCPSESSFECGSDNDCGSDGRCEPTGFCSFPDPTCASGFRYGDLAESLSNQCVIEEGTTSSSVPTSSADGSTTTTSTDGTSGGPMTSSDDSGSTFGTSTQGGSDATTETDTKGSGSTETGSTTGGPACLVNEFDVLPSLPEWFVYSNSGTAPSIEMGELLLPIDAAKNATVAFAGIRTDSPTDLSGSARIEAVVTALAEHPQATTALAINAGVIDVQASIALTIVGDLLRVELFEDDAVQVLAEQPFTSAVLPVTAEITIEGGQVTFSGSTTSFRVDLVSIDIPEWFDAAYVSLDVGNPTSDDPQGVPRFDRIEVCPTPEGV